MEKRRKKVEIEPLRQKPDYGDKKGKSVKAAQTKGIYFVDSDYKNFTVISSGVKSEGGRPVRFTGNVEFLPRRGDFITTNKDGQPSKKDRKFEVLRIEHVMYGGSLRPPRVYIVLEEK